MDSVEQSAQEMSKYCEEKESEFDIKFKMSTSESEQSLSDKTASAFPPNRAVIFMKHCSDYSDDNDGNGDEAREDNDGNGNEAGGDGDGDRYDDYDIEDFDCDISPVMTSSGKFNKNYFTIDYTDNDIAANNNHQQDLNSSLSHDEDILDTTIVPSNSAKKSLMKLFSPEKLPLRKLQMTELEEKLSPMDVSDVSSPDSHKSISDEVTQSISSFSLSEDSLTYIVDCRARPEEDSLDEISSGEISSSSEQESHVSQNISEFWDEERYLSEYNYDEPLDEDRAKNLLNFGDDYRNYIDSLSESYSSISSLSVDRRRRSKRMRKRTVVHGPQYDTQSEAEGDSLSSVLVDSEREISRVVTTLDICQDGGFVKHDCYNQYTDLMRLCQDNLTILIDCLSSAELQETFVSKKKSRDLRVLLNKWEKLLSKIKENIQHSEVYESLRTDVMSLKRDLVLVLEEREKDEDIENDAELEQKLHTFRQAMSQLCDFKSQLFNLNLSVHNFLAELHATAGAGAGKKFTTAVHLKEEVAELYQLWDRAHHYTVGNITRTEDLLAKLRLFETEVVQLRSMLSQDKRRGAGRGSWSADSGISEDSGDCQDWLTDSDERLAKLRLIADSLRRNLPADSPSISIIDRTLQSTSDQLQDLQRWQERTRARVVTRAKPRLKLRGSERSSEGAPALISSGVRRRRKVVRLAAVINFLLFLVAFLCWLSQPSCCENYNNMYLLPKLTYVNGPPPI